MEIEKNMLRHRANRNDDVTDEQWSSVISVNRELVEEFIEVRSFRPETKKQYLSGLRQFFWWNEKHNNAKPFYEISKRDFMKYISSLNSRGLSSSSIKFKKASVSSFCDYIENVVADDMKEANTFRNFTKGMPQIPQNKVYDKIPVSEEEYLKLLDMLTKEENYLALAWVAVAFNTGARRAEIIQFKTDIIERGIPEGKTYVLTDTILGKGSGDGKPVQYMVNKEAFDYMKLYIDKRDFESEYIFAYKRGGVVRQIPKDWANGLCERKLSTILGRRINPHLFKASTITHLLEKGVDIKVVSKYVAQHNDVSTTSEYYDLRDFAEERDDIFD